MFHALLPLLACVIAVRNNYLRAQLQFRYGGNWETLGVFCGEVVHIAGANRRPNDVFVALIHRNMHKIFSKISVVTFLTRADFCWCC